MASTSKKTRKLRNHARRATEERARQHRAALEAGVPLHRFTDQGPGKGDDPERYPGGITANRLEVTGLCVGGRPSFARAPNKALSLYRTKDLITARQYEAGVRLWLDYEESSIPPAIVPELGRIMVDGGKLPDWPLPNIDAERRLSAALTAITDATSRAMLIHVCINGDALFKGIFPGCRDKNAKMPRFRTALDELSRYYQTHPVN
jgi:hypothetical protein